MFVLWSCLEGPTSLWPLGLLLGTQATPPPSPRPHHRSFGGQDTSSHSLGSKFLLQLRSSSAVGISAFVLDRCHLQGRGSLHMDPRATPQGSGFLGAGVRGGGGDSSPRSWHVSSEGEQGAFSSEHGTPASSEPAPGRGFRAGVSARQGCCGEAPRAGWLSPQTAKKSKAGRPRARCRQAWLLWRFLRRTCPVTLSWPLGVCGIFIIPWLVKASPHRDFIFTWPSPCVHVSVEIAPFYKDTCRIG